MLKLVKEYVLRCLMKKFLSLSLLLLLPACQSTSFAPQGQAPLLQSQSVRPQAIVKSNFSYNADKTELTVFITKDSGEVGEYWLMRRPLGNTVVSVMTTLKHNGNVDRHKTTFSEAELVLKVAANNGWQDVYRDLKTRYELAGLTL